MEKLNKVIVLKDVGYFGWDVTNSGDKKKKEDPAASIEWLNMLERLDLDGKPSFLTDIDKLNEELKNKDAVNLSDKLLSRRKNQTIVFWEYPYSIPPVIACYVASQRGCCLDNTHFLVHGGILGVLSRCKTIGKKRKYNGPKIRRQCDKHPYRRR